MRSQSDGWRDLRPPTQGFWRIQGELTAAIANTEAVILEVMGTIQAATPGLTLRERTSYAVLAMISFCHFLNDMIQSLLPAIYPILKGDFHLNFGQVGLITFTNQLTASVLQPVGGSFTDKRPQPFSLTIGMAFTLVGLVMLSTASTFPLILAAAAMVGIGSAVFYPG